MAPRLAWVQGCFTSRAQALRKAGLRPSFALSLLLVALLAEPAASRALAQANSNPNQITGLIEWNNPAGPVRTYLDTPAHGLGPGTMHSSDTSAVFTGTTPIPDDASHLSAPYSIDVQAGTSVGIQHYLAPQMFTADGFNYWFETALSAGVVFPPATPDAVLNFSECAGLVEVSFRDPAGNPVTVSSGNIFAYMQSTGFQQAGGYFGLTSSIRIPVRSGTPFNVIVNVAMTSGTDPAVDYFSITESITYPVTVNCDQILALTFVVPPVPTGSPPPGSLGQIIGLADVLGEDEHWFDQGRTILNAFNGPYGNYRYAFISPLTQPGYLPCAVASPQVGTLSCNSAGPFSLINLLPSAFSTPSRDYTVAAGFYFDLFRHFEFFVSPYLPAVDVPSVQLGGVVDLGKTFVIEPGYVQGDIYLCGPDEDGITDSPLRHLLRTSDFHDADGDGIAEGDADMNLYSKVIANGLGVLGTGATHTAAGGHARALFAGDFVAFGPDKDHFVGDYRLTLGGLNNVAGTSPDTTRWDLRHLYLEFGNGATPNIPNSYLNAGVTILNDHFADVAIVPTQTVINHHRYGLCEVTIGFHTTSGTLFGPSVYAAGSFTGLNFEGQPAQYTAGGGGLGTPLDLSTADDDGQVVFVLPEGTYTIYPTVSSVNGGSVSTLTLQPFTLTVPACGKIRVFQELQLNVDPIPECAPQAQLNITGAVTSTADVASLTYTLNGDTVAICSACGNSPAFNFNVALADCDNALQITATDVDGRVSSLSKTVRFDLVPPVLTGCQDQTVMITPGAGGANVSFAVTANDLCDGILPVVSDPPSGSFFPEGATRVTCEATDECGNTGTCTFIVTVTGADTMPPTIQCPFDIVTGTDPGLCSAVVTYTVTASDDRPGVTVVCSPPSGSTFPKGATTVTCTATDAAGNTATCSFTVTVRDTEAPEVECVPTTNPSGGKIPSAGNNPKSGHNPDGFFELVATDNCDATAGLQIFIKDSAQGPCGGTFMAGPYQPGDKVKLTQSGGQTSVKPMAGVILAHINTRNDPVLVVTDSAGNTTCHLCLLPRPPK